MILLQFETYVLRYTQSFPGVSIDDFPSFEDFDYDKNGLVSFSEWETYLTNQKKLESKLDILLQKEEKKEKEGKETDDDDDSIQAILSSIQEG